MESTKNRKKGLLSIVSLIVCLAMLTVGTYAWFTDTATVGGNKVMAGNLDVAIVMTGKEILQKLGENPDAESYDLSTKWPDVVEADNSPFKGVKRIDGESDPSLEAYYDVSGMKANMITLGNMEPGQIQPVVMKIANPGELAIGFTAGFNLPLRDEEDPTQGYTSYTGLETLEMQRAESNNLLHFAADTAGTSGLGDKKPKQIETKLDDDEAAYREKKLLAKQWDAKAAEDASVTYTAAQAGGAYDLGGHLEDVLEVYAVSMAEYEDYFLKNPAANNTWKNDTAEFFTNKSDVYKPKTDAEGNVIKDADGKTVYDTDDDGNKIKIGETPNVHFIGTITDILNCNDETYVKETLPQMINDAKAAVDSYKLSNPLATVDNNLELKKLNDEWIRLMGEPERLEGIQKKLSTSSSGYCVPKGALVLTEEGKNVDENGKLTVKLNNTPSGTIKVSDIGTAVYLIKMSEDAGDIYQNAYIELDMGVTANQVKWEKDGVNNYLYDPTPVFN